MERSKYYDIVKGLGIISIVIGHSCYFAYKYVYIYHLAIFLFISGILFNEAKYATNPYLILSAKLKSLWPKYVYYSVLFIIFRNLLISIGIYSVSYPKYSLRDMIQNIFNAIFMVNTEPMAGALWFVPMFLFSLCLFGIIIYFSNYLFNTPKYKYFIVIFFSIVIGIIGILLNLKKIELIYNVHTSLLLTPFICAGYIIQKMEIDIKKYFNLFIFLASTCSIYIFVNIFHYEIDLSAEMLGSPALFFPITFAGIYICLCLGSVIEHQPFLSRIISSLGKYSFDIMALHFFVFKLIDLIVFYIFMPDLINSISQFPYSFKNLWAIYLLIGNFLPVLYALLHNYLKCKIITLCKK